MLPRRIEYPGCHKLPHSSLQATAFLFGGVPTCSKAISGVITAMRAGDGGGTGVLHPASFREHVLVINLGDVVEGLQFMEQYYYEKYNGTVGSVLVCLCIREIVK